LRRDDLARASSHSLRLARSSLEMIPLSVRLYRVTLTRAPLATSSSKLAKFFRASETGIRATLFMLYNSLQSSVHRFEAAFSEDSSHTAAPPTETHEAMCHDYRRRLGHHLHDSTLVGAR
jgi:hypothetical protein